MATNKLPKQMDPNEYVMLRVKDSCKPWEQQPEVASCRIEIRVEVHIT